MPEPLLPPCTCHWIREAATRDVDAAGGVEGGGGGGEVGDVVEAESEPGVVVPHADVAGANIVKRSIDPVLVDELIVR